MKKTRIISIALMCAMVSGSLWGCRETEQEEPVNTELKVLTQSVQVPVEGGEAVIEFSLTDPVEGAEVTVRPFSEWAHDPVVSMPADGGTEGSITLTVDANPDYTSRTADVKVSYTEGDFNYTVPIVQAGLEPEFQITATDPTTYSAIVSVTPLDKDMPYWISYIDKDKYETYSSDAELFEDNIQYWDEYYILEFFLQEQLINGDFISKELVGLQAGTDYFIYVYGVDKSTGRPTTPLYKTAITTLQVEKTDMSFDIETNVSGNYAEIKINPSNDTIPYFYTVLSQELIEDSYDDGTGNLSTILENYIQGFISFSLTSPYNFFKMYSDTGDGGDVWDSLDPFTNYKVLCAGWDGGCNLISDVSEYEFETTVKDASDNKITLNAWSPGSTSVFYSVETTNMDPYILWWFNNEEVDDMTNQEIFEYLLQLHPVEPWFNSLDLYANNGNVSNINNGLSPNTEYCVIAFGYTAGIMNTEMQRVSFKTTEPGEITSYNMDYFFKIGTFPGYAIIGFCPQENGQLYYPGIVPCSYNQEDIEQMIINMAESESLNLSGFLLANSKTDIFNTVYETAIGQIDEGIEYRAFAVGLTSDGEYAQDFVFSEPFILTSTSSSTTSPSQDIQTGSMTSEFSSEPNAHEDLIRQFNEYLKSR